MAWMTDVMETLYQHDIGWAPWNFRGSFGVVDSGREDVDYEEFQGHKVDGKLRRLLRKS